LRALGGMWVPLTSAIRRGSLAWLWKGTAPAASSTCRPGREPEATTASRRKPFCNADVQAKADTAVAKAKRQNRNDVLLQRDGAASARARGLKSY
jgi:hypothetical protein